MRDWLTTGRNSFAVSITRKGIEFVDRNNTRLFHELAVVKKNNEAVSLCLTFEPYFYQATPFWKCGGVHKDANAGKGAIAAAGNQVAHSVGGAPRAYVKHTSHVYSTECRAHRCSSSARN